MVNKIFYFDNMLTPKIITVVYWILLAAVVLGGLGAMFGTGTFTGFITGLAGMAFGLVLVRIWCELLIVLFKINANLQKMAEKE